MGLMLSILITCVGVAELFAFYTNVRRRLVMPLHPSQPPPQVEHDMGRVTQNYLKELNRERNRLLNEIRRFEDGQRNSKSVSPDPNHFKNITEALTDNISLGVSSSTYTHVVQTPQNATDISTAIFREDYIAPDTPPKSFVDDKHVRHIFPSYSDAGQKKAVIDLHRTSNEEAPRIVLNEFEHREREGSPFPTYERMAPRGSICSELIVNPTISVDEEDEEGFRSRTPSDSQQEEGFRSRTPSDSQQISDEFLKSQFDSRDYWKHKSKSRSRTPEILRENRLDFEKQSRSRSPSPLAPKQQEQEASPKVATRSSAAADLYKAPTAVPIEKAEYSGITITELPPEDSPPVEKEVLEMVDGKLTQHEEHKRMFKNKKQRNKNKKPNTNEQSLLLEQQRIERQCDPESMSESGSSNIVEMDDNALDGSKFKDVVMEEMQEAGPSSSKQGEPFWVKKT